MKNRLLLIVSLLSLFTATAAAQKEYTPIELGWIGKTPAGPTPVSFGVPFAQGEIPPRTSFVLATEAGEEIPADHWKLASWPDGSLKWVGFATVVPERNDKMWLTPRKKGEVRSAGSIRIEESADHISVSTGPLTATLSGSGKNLFNELLLNDNKVAGAASLVCLLESRNKTAAGSSIEVTEYRSEIISMEVEQAGEVRSVIKIEGVYTDGVRQWLPFVVRLYFYAGSEQVKLVHTIIYDGDAEQDFIKGLGLSFEVPMREALYNRHIAFSGYEKGVWSEPVQPLTGRRELTLNGDHTLYKQQLQGKRLPPYEEFDERNRKLIDDWASWDGYRLSQLLPDAFSVRKRAMPDSPWIGTVSSSRSSGLAFAGDVSGGLAVCLQDFWQSYPSTLEVNNARTDTATLTVWLWSPEGEVMDLRHYDEVAHGLEASYEDVQEGLSTPYGVACTSVVKIQPLSAYPGKESISQLASTLSGTNQLICTPEYLQSKHAFGIWSLPNLSTPFRAWVEERLDGYIDYYQKQIEQHKWYGFWNYGDVMHAYDAVRHEWRYDIGGFAWDNTELASNMWLWYMFLRSGREDIWKMAEAMSRHTPEVDVYHLGAYAGLGTRHNVSHWGCGAKEARVSQAAWNRFYYYLTTDERTGDLMTEVKDADLKLYTLDPMRLAQPREKYPSSAPARLRVGPDWLAYVGNWMTEWERTGNTLYRDKIITGMKSIAALPNGLYTGPGVLGYDPATGEITYEGDPELQNTNHLMTIMAGFEIMNELLEMIDIPQWNEAWVDHAARYTSQAWKIKRSVFLVPKLTAHGALYYKDRTLAQ
ncbi:MAG: hypothetical protein LUE93_03215 [Bacteroides sp.]|nr:hypothetical protein [Bacteroides sp.]